MTGVRFLFSFRGRCRRSEWWVITIGAIFFANGLNTLISVNFSAASADPEVRNLIAFLEILSWTIFSVSHWISLAANVKRLHDMGWSGWWALPLTLVPVGFVVFLGIEGFVELIFDAELGIELFLLTILAILICHLFLGSKRGQPFTNRYGPEAVDNLP